jgi:hypothetical protein
MSKNIFGEKHFLVFGMYEKSGDVPVRSLILKNVFSIKHFSIFDVYAKSYSCWVLGGSRQGPDRV